MIYNYLVQVISHNIKTYLTYASPEDYENGTFVFFELRKQDAFGIIIEKTKTKESFTILPIKKSFSASFSYKKFLEKVEKFYILEEFYIIKRILKIPSKKISNTKENYTKEKKEHKTITLNNEQEIIFNDIITLEDKEKKTYLLKGVTGSGKTLLFLKLIEHYATIKHKSVICLFPNTHLAHTVAQEIKHYNKELPIFEYHCQAENNEKIECWKRIFEKKNTIIIGVHLPAFLPIDNLGFCIVDEEHDSGYQECQSPYLNSKDCLTLRTKIENVPLLFSSATPSATSMYHAIYGTYAMGTLKNKFFPAKSPKIQTIKLKNKKEILSETLVEMIADTLKKNEQTILFVPRKGFFIYAACSQCQTRIFCSQCSIPLTVYANHIGKCNYCKDKKTIPEFCQLCKEKTKIKKIGYGIDQVCKKVQELFPTAKIKQVESESLKKKEETKTFLNDINDQKYDIIIGTQVLIKGYNFFHVSLIGIIQGDHMLQIPFYKNTEEMIQQIIQMSGRAGRKGLTSSIVIQSFHEHNLENFFSEQNYDTFITEELEYRKNFQLPPYKKLAIILIKTKKKELSKKIADSIYEKIRVTKKETTEIFKPQIPAHEKIKSQYYQTITLKTEKYSDVTEIIKNEIKKYRKKNESYVFYIPNPTQGLYE